MQIRSPSFGKPEHVHPNDAIIICRDLNLTILAFRSHASGRFRKSVFLQLQSKKDTREVEEPVEDREEEWKIPMQLPNRAIGAKLYSIVQINP